MPRVRLPITTERLVVRSLRPGDEADVFVYRSVPEVVRYIPGDPKTEEQVADLVAERATAGRVDATQRFCTLAVELDGRVIGDVLIHLDGLDGADGRQAEIGWVFAPDVAGSGYATEAARAIASAVCASISLAVTSPIAKTFGKLVRPRPSTAMAPPTVICRPSHSRP
jgi:aminoglycoside 6'-N-acetyltransferase